MQTITLQPKEVYGNTLYYPSCPISALILDLMGRKTFNLHQIDKLKKHYNVIIK